MQESLYYLSFLPVRNCIRPVSLNIKFNHNKISCTILQATCFSAVIPSLGDRAE